jgi:signal transduction histidine kinase/ActR/RegA family two-component response regulator
MFTGALVADITDTPLRPTLRVLLAALCVMLAATVSLSFSQHGQRVTPVWLANAFALAFCLKADPRRWPEILAGAFLGNLGADLLAGDSAPLALGLSACNGVEVELCAILLLRLIGRDLDLTRRRDLLVFLAASSGSAVIAALLGALVLGLMKGAASLLDLGVWTLADAVGLIMVTPVLLMLADVRAQLRARPVTALRLAPLVLLTLVTGAVFSQERYPLFFLIPPLWAMAAAELELLGLTAGAVIVSTIAIGATYAGFGPAMLVKGDEVHRMAVLQTFIAFSTVTLLQFTSSVVQRRRLTQSLEAMNHQAEQRRAGAVEDHRRAQMAEAVAGLGYWRIDLKSQAIDWSSQIYTLFDLPRSTPPRPGTITELIHPDDLPQARAAFQRIVATGEPQHMEGRIITREGRLRVIRSWSTAELDDEGRTVAVLYVMMDVTEQRRVESELRQARDAAEQAAEVKAEFLANMSHELRTPLTSILGFTALAGAEREMPDTVRHYIDRVTVASKALLTLVNDVLDFSKLEAGEIRLAPRPVDMAALCREVLDMFGEQAGTKGIGLAFAPAGMLPEAVALDTDRVRQVLINLVGNAVKFTGAGGVTLTAGYDSHTAMLSVSVLDTGPGIGEDRRSSLFQRFSQIDGSSTRTFGGTGLGLAICKGLIEAMGGEIGVDTCEGQGSRFWFEIPTTAVDPAQAASASATVAALSLGNRFLVVDDNRANRDLVRAILASLGAEIVEASDGLEGVKAAMELPFDVILMDMRMPGMNGEEAVAEIRRGGPNAGCPIIAFSASADAGQMEHLRRLGFDSCLPKPFTLTDLIRAVETALAMDPPIPGIERHG